MQGWIKLHRQIRGHAFFQQKRKFSRFEAWVDMLLEANHCDKPWIAGNEIITVKRGDFVTSETKLASRWRWSRTKVRAFLKLLEDEKMIVKKADSKKTTISVVNYDIYQNQETSEEHQKNIKKTSKKHQKNTTKNDKNDKNEKNEKKVPPLTPPKVEYAEFVKMTEAEYCRLIDRFGELSTKKMIEILDDYKGAHGKTYKSDYRAILTWVVEKYKEGQRKAGGAVPAGWDNLREWYEEKKGGQHD